jgi:hypothetical protein
MASNDYKTGNPARQGFYRVRTEKGDECIAEWREYDKSIGKRWYLHISADPTLDKKPVPLDGVNAYAKADDREVKNALTRLLTIDEKIEASVKQYRSNRDASFPFNMPIPLNRKLTIGQAVSLGHLRNPVVIALHDNDQAVTVEYQNIEIKGGQEIDKGLCIGTRYWLDVLPRPPVFKTDLAVTPKYRTQAYFNTHLDMLIRRMYREGVTDSPDFQRGYTWTQKDKELYLDTVFNGRDLGRFIFIKETYPNADVLFDGKQRMQTLMELVGSVLPYKGVYWHEMAFKDRNLAVGQAVQFADLDAQQYSRADLLQMFLDVNAAGVPQTPEHLAKVRSLLDEELAAPVTVG